MTTQSGGQQGGQDVKQNWNPNNLQVGADYKGTDGTVRIDNIDKDTRMIKAHFIEGQKNGQHLELQYDLFVQQFVLGDKQQQTRKAA